RRRSARAARRLRVGLQLPLHRGRSHYLRGRPVHGQVPRSMTPRRIALLSTGGTIEKTYNESDGTITNQRSVLEIMLAGLVLRGVVIDRVPVMNKDSLFMSEEDHER